MRKIKSLIAALLVVVFVVTMLPTNTYAADIPVPEMPVQKLNNKKVFSLLRSSVSSSTIQKNKNYNRVLQKLPQYVYNQNRVDLNVGDCKFKNVGCELAACYNATIELSPLSLRADRKLRLADYIYYAEANKYTMSFNSSNSTALAKELLNTYFNTWSVYIARILLGDSMIGAIVSLMSSSYGFNKAACFGTDPYAIPDILNKGGVIKVTNTFNSYNSMLECVNANLHYSKPKKVYILSYWNYPTLNECFAHESGFHTICFYTTGGQIYTLNNNYNSPNSTETVKSFERIMGNQKRFIVGYCVTLK